MVKKKLVRGNEAASMTKELSKAIMNRSKLKNRYTKWPSRENFLAFKIQKNICKDLNKKTKKNYFSKITSNGVIGNKQFWNTVKPFLTYKGFPHNEDIALHIGDKTVTDCNELVKEFNEYYINIVQNTTGKATIKLQGSNSDKSTVETIIKTYGNHPSIKLIKEHIQKENNDFNVKAASVGEINKIIKSLNPKKATGPDKIPVKIDSNLTNIINNDLSNNALSDFAKLASVRPIYKKDDRNGIKNYRPASIFFRKYMKSFYMNNFCLS